MFCFWSWGRTGIKLLPSPQCEWIACGAKGGPSWSWLMQHFQLACHLFSWEMGPSCAVRAWKAKYLLPCEWAVWCQSYSGHSCGSGRGGSGVTLPPEHTRGHHGAWSCHKTLSHQEILHWDWPLRCQGWTTQIQAAVLEEGAGCVHTNFSTVRPWSLLTTNKNKNKNCNNNLLLDCKETSISGGWKKNVHWLHLQIPLPYD